MAYKGVDISEHNGVVDYDALINAGVRFVIIRISAGRNVDKCWAANIAECEKRGIPYGVYHYSYALSDEYAANEAALVIKTLAGRKPPLGVWYDMEDADSYKKNNGLDPWSSGDKLTGFCAAFCKAVAAAGLQAGVYASASWLTSLLDMSRLSAYKVWSADWTAPNDYKGTSYLWQYTSSWTIGGKRFDGNYFYGTLPETASTEKTAEEITVDNMIADKVTTEANRAYWLAVLQGKKTVNVEWLKKILDNYHIVK